MRLDIYTYKMEHIVPTNYLLRKKMAIDADTVLSVKCIIKDKDDNIKENNKLIYISDNIKDIDVIEIYVPQILKELDIDPKDYSLKVYLNDTLLTSWRRWYDKQKTDNI